MTTKDIIKILPFEKEFKQDLLLKYDGYTLDQRFQIERVIWGFYYALYQAHLDKNMQLAFERAKRDEEPLDGEFYARVHKQTDEELQKEYTKAETEVDISSAREELEKIIKQTN